MHECRSCRSRVEDRFRYCPWCSTPQRTKFVEFFAPHPAIDGDSGKGLRVSRYLGDAEKPPQVRLSIWSGDSAAAAISLTDDEAGRLARFVAPQPAPSRRPLRDQLRESLHI
ncbi:MAG: hypothetical protein ACRDLK_01890 [Gaiellaceae bacterium]